MAPLELPFVTLDVFATTRYKGNPLAVVTIPAGTNPYPTQDQKQRIAQEFNLSETVFVHEDHPSPVFTKDAAGAELDRATTRSIDIFITDAEIPFAGHPTIGTAVHLIPNGITTLVTKAGPIAINELSGQPGYLSAAIPHNVRQHTRTLADLTPEQSRLKPGDLQPDADLQALELKSPFFSIVKGMNFMLIELSSLDQLSRVSTTPAHFDPEGILDEGWNHGVIGREYFVRLPSDDKNVVKIRSRMMLQGFEDPATGSASCALAVFLTLKDGRQNGITTYQIDQGIEMGRDSHIVVEVGAKDGQIDTVSLAGTATQVMRGYVTV